MNVNPGKLDKSIQIQRFDRSTDSDGYYTESWSTVHTLWANFSRLSGAEAREHDADFARVQVRFLVRYREDIDRKMTVLYRGNRYEIEYLNDYGDRHEYLEILAWRLTQEAKA